MPSTGGACTQRWCMARPAGFVPPGRRFSGVLAGWRVGLAVGPGVRPDLHRLAGGDLQVVRRDPGAEAWQALQRALRSHEVRASRRRGPLGTGHLGAARRVAYGAADVAVIMEAAARTYGLDFHPLEDHVAELRVARSFSDLPGTSALLELIASRPFRARLEALGGSDVSRTGQAA